MAIVAMRSRLWGLSKFVLVLGALTGTFVVFAFLGMRVALRAREVAVPSVVGQPLAEASRALTQQGLVVKVDDSRRPDGSRGPLRERTRRP